MPCGLADAAAYVFLGAPGHGAALAIVMVMVATGRLLMFDAWWLHTLPGERLPSAVSWSAKTLPPLAIMGAAIDRWHHDDHGLAARPPQGRGLGGLKPWSLTCPSLHANALGSNVRFTSRSGRNAALPSTVKVCHFQT